MKMDRAIPVEVARFRTKEGLVYREVCGATEGRLLTQPALLIYRSPARFPRGDALCGLRTENSAVRDGGARDSRSSVLVLPGESFAERLTASAKR